MTRVRVTQGSGLDSGKCGVIVPLSQVKTNHRGIPKLPGHYQPIGRNEVAVLLDNGELITMFKNRLEERR